MEKYEKVKAGYNAKLKQEAEAKKQQEMKTQQQLNKQKKQASIRNQQKKPVQGIPPILQPPNENPYKDIFSW